MLFLGISDDQKDNGGIRTYKFPLSNAYQDYLAHDYQGIEKMRTTPDDTHLVTAGRDGCIMFFEIKVTVLFRTRRPVG